MKTRLLSDLNPNPIQLACRYLAAVLLAGGLASARGQDGNTAPPPPAWFQAPATSGVVRSSTNPPPPQAAVFARFAPRVTVSWDDQYLYVQNNGLPAHGLMAGITAWQQQVPLPQPYFGENAWAIPLHPVPTSTPRPIKNDFLRGAVAVGVDGIPIFNPQNNRGEISQEIGELDWWGGHCGRADDYHYHVAPLFLQATAGPGQPIAYALDGYPIYGLTEPDGSAPGALDICHGHETPGLGYHYHASTNYPYVMAAFHGQVVERNGQVDPQPRAQPIRPAQPPLPGATISSLTVSPDEKSFALKYAVDGQPAAVNYTNTGPGVWKFQYVNADGTTRAATYHAGGRTGEPPPRDVPQSRQRQPRPDDRRDGAVVPVNFTPPRSGHMVLSSPVVTNGGALPVEFTGDGAGVSPPLAWSGAPPATQAYAIIMHHFPGPGDVKWYWTLYNLPATVHQLPRNATGIGTAGNNSVNRQLGYAPPHSKGPGAKTYYLTVYALSAPVSLSVPPAQVSRNVLLTAMKGLVLDSAELKFTYDRTAFIERHGGSEPPPERDGQDRPNP